MLTTKNHFKYNEISRQKIKRWKEIYHGNINERKAGVTALVSIYLRAENITRNRDIPIHKDIAILNMYALSKIYKAKINRIVEINYIWRFQLLSQKLKE